MNFLVALKAEAGPLIDFYRLNQVHATPFPTFENQNHRLVISGIGRIRCSAATGYLLGLLPSKIEGLINLGIAGHGQLEKAPFLSPTESLSVPKKKCITPHRYSRVPFPPAASGLVTNRKNNIPSLSDMTWKLMPFAPSPTNG